MTLIYELINEIMVCLLACLLLITRTRAMWRVLPRNSFRTTCLRAPRTTPFNSWFLSPPLASHAQNKLSTLVGQDLGMKTIVDKMKSTGDLYIDVIENVHCVLDCNVPFPFLSPPL